MAAYKDSKGRWRWRVRAHNPFTNEETRLSGTAPKSINTKKAAEDAERAEVARYVMDPAKRPSEPAELLIKNLAVEYLERLKLNPEREFSYLQKVEVNLRCHIIPDLGERRADRITDEDLEDYKLFLQNKERAVRGRWHRPSGLSRKTVGEFTEQYQERSTKTSVIPRIKARTVKDILRVLFGVFRYGVDRKRIPQMPLFPAPPKAEQALPAFLDFDEERRLYEAARTPEERFAMMVAVRTGMRQGEQMAAKWTDIDWTNSRINIVRAAKKDGTVGVTKGKKQRSVDLEAPFMAELRKHRSLCELICPAPDGTMLTNKHCRVMIAQALKRAGIIKEFSWHDLRHTYGSQQAISGVPLRQIQQSMGHASITTTEIYAHLSSEGGAKAAKQVADERGW